MARHRYTEEQIAFLFRHKDLTYDKITKLFNARFNTSVSLKAIKSVMLRKGMRTKNFASQMSDEQRQYITENFTKMKGKEFARLFNHKFETNFSIHTIRSFANKQLGLKKSQGSFRRVVNQYDVVTRQTGRRKRYLVAINDDPGRKKYISLERFIYENHHRVDTSGKHIIHLDGDIENFDIENLYCLECNEMALTKMLLGNKLIATREKELSLAAIGLAKLILKLREQE